MRLGIGLGAVPTLIRSAVVKVVGFVYNGATSPVRTQGVDGFTSGMSFISASIAQLLYQYDMEPEDGLTSGMSFVSGSMAQQLYQYDMEPEDGLASGMSLVSASMVIP